MALPIKFPPQTVALSPQSPQCLRKIYSAKEFEIKIKHLCQQNFNETNLFNYTAIDKKQILLLKCNKPKCASYFLYQEDYEELQSDQKQNQQFVKIYMLKQYEFQHYHKQKEFKNSGYKYLQQHLQLPQVIYFPCHMLHIRQKFPEKYHTIFYTSEAVKQFTKGLNNDYRKKEGATQLMFNAAYNRNLYSKLVIQCRFSHLANDGIRCCWKMVFFKQNKNDNQVFAINFQQSNLKHVHYVKSLKERDKIFQQNIRKNPMLKPPPITYEKPVNKIVKKKQKRQKRYKKIKKFEQTEQKEKPQQQLEQPQQVQQVQQQLYKQNKIAQENILEEKNAIQNEDSIHNKIYDSYKQYFEISCDENLPMHVLFKPLLKGLKTLKFDKKYLKENDSKKVLKYMAQSGQIQEVAESYIENSDKKQNSDFDQALKKKQEYTQQIEKNGHIKEFDDFVIISSKLMRYLCRAYGEIVYLIQQKFEESQKTDKQISLLLFFGPNFNQDIAFFGSVLCRNLNFQKFYKILLIFFKHHLKKLKTIIIRQDIQEAIYAARMIKNQQGYDFNILSMPNAIQRKQCQIGFSYESQLIKYWRIATKRKSKLKRFKLFDNYLGINSNYDQQNAQQSKYHNFNDAEKQMIHKDNANNSNPYETNFIVGSTHNIAMQTLRQLDKTKKEAIQRLNSICFRTFSDSLYIKNIIKVHECVSAIHFLIIRKNNNWAIKNKKNSPVQYYFSYPQLQDCRKLMSDYMMNQLIHQIGLIQKNSIIDIFDTFAIVQNQSSSLIVEIKQCQDERQSIGFGFLKPKQKKQYCKDTHTCECQCGFQERTGIPCSHMLKVMLQLELRLLQSIRLERIINFGIVKPGKQKIKNKLARGH